MIAQMLPRATAWMCVLLGVASLRCADPGFVCGGDEECTLSGTPGVCLAGGRCAYPAAECPSGLAFPAGAPVDAGQCVPEGEGGSEGPADSSTGSSTAAEDPDDSSGAGSATGVACSDANEPNDDPGSPTPLPFAPMCLTQWEGAIDGPGDVDWFFLEDLERVCGGSLTVVADGVEVCAQVLCAPAGPRDLLECSGEVRPLEGGFDGCCGESSVSLLSACTEAAVSLTMIRVASSSGGPECAPYMALATSG